MQKPYEGKEPYIFVSYSHKDTGEVLGIIERLMQEGYRVWYDEGIECGVEWDEYIDTRIESCAVFMPFFSGHFLESENCKDELALAKELRKELISVFLEDVQLPPGKRMWVIRKQNLRKYQYDEEEWFYGKLFGSMVLGMCMENEKPEGVLLDNICIPSLEERKQFFLGEQNSLQCQSGEETSPVTDDSIQPLEIVGQDAKTLEEQYERYSEMAKKSMDAGDLLVARKEYEECLKICEKLVEQNPKNRFYKFYQDQIAYDFGMIGDALESQGDLNGAKQLYEESLTIYKKLAKKVPDNRPYQYKIAVVLYQIGNILESQGDLRGAKQLYEESLTICKKLAKKAPRDRYFQNLIANILYSIGDILKSQGDLTGAKQLYEESLTIHKKLAEPCPEDKFYQSKIADDLDRIAEIEQILRGKQEPSQCQSEENVPKGTMMSLAEFFAPAEEIKEEPAQVLPAGDSSEDTIGSSYKVFGAVSRKHELMKVLSLYMDEMEHFLGSCFYFFDSESYRNDMDYQKRADRRLKWAIKRYAKEVADEHIYLLDVAENFLLTDSHLYTKYGGRFKLSEIKIGFEWEWDSKPFDLYRIYFTKGKDRFSLWTGFDDEAITFYNMLNKFIETAKSFQ